METCVTGFLPFSWEYCPPPALLLLSSCSPPFKVNAHLPGLQGPEHSYSTSSLYTKAESQDVRLPWCAHTSVNCVAKHKTQTNYVPTSLSALGVPCWPSQTQSIVAPAWLMSSSTKVHSVKIDELLVKALDPERIQVDIPESAGFSGHPLLKNHIYIACLSSLARAGMCPVSSTESLLLHIKATGVSFGGCPICFLLIAG